MTEKDNDQTSDEVTVETTSVFRADFLNELDAPAQAGAETAVSVPACAGASSSLRKSARKTDVVSTVTSSEVWSLSFSVTRCSSLAAAALSGWVRSTGFPPALTVDVSTVPRT